MSTNLTPVMCYYTGFWGGLVPENAFNPSALEGLLKAGVLGLKVRFPACRQH
jgi:hypothetical protein